MKSKWGQKSTLEQRKNIFAVTVHSTIPMLPNNLQIDWHLPRINMMGSVYKYVTGSAKTEHNSAIQIFQYKALKHIG